MDRFGKVQQKSNYYHAAGGLIQTHYQRSALESIEEGARRRERRFPGPFLHIGEGVGSCYQQRTRDRPRHGQDKTLSFANGTRVRALAPSIWLVGGRCHASSSFLPLGFPFFVLLLFPRGEGGEGGETLSTIAVFKRNVLTGERNATQPKHDAETRARARM